MKAVIALLLTLAVTQSLAAKKGRFCTYLDSADTPTDPCSGKTQCISVGLGECVAIKNTPLSSDPYGSWVKNTDGTINVYISAMSTCTDHEYAQWINISCTAQCAKSASGFYMNADCNAAGATAPVAFLAVISALLVLMF